MSDCMQMGRCPILLEETFTVPPSNKVHISVILIVIPNYTFLKVFTSFVKTKYILKTLIVPTLHFCATIFSFFLHFICFLC